MSNKGKFKLRGFESYEGVGAIFKALREARAEGLSEYAVVPDEAHGSSEEYAIFSEFPLTPEQIVEFWGKDQDDPERWL